MAEKTAAERTAERIFATLCSLKLAVLVILSLAIALAAATFIESLYDTACAQYWIYRTNWFYGLLFLLGLNIFCVAVSRFPWKFRHVPFLLAHLGILILLLGSWITYKVGIDGSLRISEGEAASIVDLDAASLFVYDRSELKALPIKWIPPTVSFTPIRLASHGLSYPIVIDQFVSHAEPIVSFISDGIPAFPSEKKSPALKIRVKGGPMQISQEIWLWHGTSEWKDVQAGPARFSIRVEGESEGEGTKTSKTNGPTISFFLRNKGDLSFVAKSSAGKIVRGTFKRDEVKGQVLQPGWKGGVTITMEEWFPNAVPSTTYKPARIQYGNQAPGSAIHLRMADGKDGVWLGLGERAVLQLEKRQVEIAYYPKRVVLPFSIRLDRFNIEHDEGTVNPASYSSNVTVEGRQSTISMNEPLETKDYTFYQASYENAMPRPVTSIFTVNRDPGRPWKYGGSLLIVLGTILLFVMKYLKFKAVKKSPVLTARLGDA